MLSGLKKLEISATRFNFLIAAERRGRLNFNAIKRKDSYCVLFITFVFSNTICREKQLNIISQYPANTSWIYWQPRL